MTSKAATAVPYGHFSWNELATRDSEAGVTFYTQLFGWDRRDQEMPGMETPYKMVRMNGEDLAGMYDMAGPQFEGVPPHWMNYVQVEDVDAVAAKVEPAGGKLLFPPMDIPGVGRMAAFVSPEGAALSLFQPGQSKGRPDMGNKHGSFCWAELYTHDTDAAEAFYLEVLPWEAARKDGGPMPYTEWVVGGNSVGGMMKISPEMGPVPPHWMTYIAVDDCDACVTRATELGGQVKMPAMTIEGVGRFAILEDPTGASFAVITLDPAHC